MTLQPKELVVATLRDFFSNDRFYSYRHDQWGYPQTPGLINTLPTAGINDSVTTRVFIGEAYRFDVDFFPAILVKDGGKTSVPISATRESYCTNWGELVFEDGYGNIKTFPTPRSYEFKGAYEGNITIEVKAKDLRARDDLIDLISLLFIDISFNDLYHAGLIVQGVSSGTPAETQDRNDFFFTQTITLKCRSEWRREIPICSLVEIINFSVDIGANTTETSIIAPNMTIDITKTLWEMLSAL
jgi:hypothetical protein